MGIRRNVFDTNYPVHIISRAVEERNIFNNDVDCFRFIFQIYATNVGRPVRNLWRQDIVKAAQSLLAGEDLSSRFIIKEHLPLVHILDFSLVVNHDHFYLLPASENSIPIFMQKLNAGFAAYNNLKYGRKGALFGSRYKDIIVKTQFQSDALSRYINTINPLDVFQPGWRENGLKDPEEAFKFLKSYQFSSFPDKIGDRKSKILAPQEILAKYLTLGFDAKTCREFAENFLSDRSNASYDFFLE